MTPTVDFESGVKRSQSTNLVVSNKDILSLYNHIDAGIVGGFINGEATLV